MLAAPRLLLLLSLATLPMCDSEATQLARQITDAKGDCDAQGLKASDEACVQMMQRYAEMGTEAIRTYIGAVKALDAALQRMPAADFDTSGIGHAFTFGPATAYPDSQAAADGLAPGAPSADYLPLRGGVRAGAAAPAPDGWSAPYGSAYPSRSYDPRGAAGPGYGADRYGDRGYDPRGYASPGYGSRGYGSGGYGSGTYSSRGYDPRGYGSPGYGSSAYGRQGYAYPGYGADRYGTRGYGARGYDGRAYDPRYPGAYDPRGYGPRVDHGAYSDPRWNQDGYGRAYPGEDYPPDARGGAGWDDGEGSYDEGAYDEAPRTGTGGAARAVPPGRGLLLPPGERLDRPWLHDGGGAPSVSRYRAGYPDAYLAPASRDTLGDAGRSRRPTRPPDRN